MTPYWFNVLALSGLVSGKELSSTTRLRRIKTTNRQYRSAWIKFCIVRSNRRYSRLFLSQKSFKLLQYDRYVKIWSSYIIKIPCNPTEWLRGNKKLSKYAKELFFVDSVMNNILSLWDHSVKRIRIIRLLKDVRCKNISTAEFPPNKILKKPMLQRVMICIGWSWLLSHKSQVKR